MPEHATGRARAGSRDASPAVEEANEEAEKERLPRAKGPHDGHHRNLHPFWNLPSIAFRADVTRAVVQRTESCITERRGFTSMERFKKPHREQRPTALHLPAYTTVRARSDSWHGWTVHRRRGYHERGRAREPEARIPDVQADSTDTPDSMKDLHPIDCTRRIRCLEG